MIKWKVGEKPTGRFKSFTYRSWPIASYTDDDTPAVQIVPVERGLSYDISRAETTELYVSVADYREVGFVWLKLQGRAMGLAAAKERGRRMIEEHHARLRDRTQSIVPKR